VAAIHINATNSSTDIPAARINAQRSRSYFAVLRDRQARRVSRLDENDVASALAILDPSRLLENPHGPLPRDAGQSGHLRRNLNLSDFNC
jgi:hypothetical protein